MKLIFRTTGDGQRLSVRELARRAGMSEEGVRLIMTGKRRPSLESGLKLARALGRSPWWILEYSQRVRRIPESARAIEKHRRHLIKAFGR
jgi:transcriptional regulator with XRE-family HTH domain